MSSRAGIAADHPLTAEAGAEVLRAGGNAYDAAMRKVPSDWASAIAAFEESPLARRIFDAQLEPASRMDFRWARHAGITR